MAQIVTKFIKDLAVVSGSSAAHGKIGSGAATAAQALFADGAGGTSFRSVLSTDIPTISGSQVSGGTFGAVNGSALTNLAAANLSGVLPVGVTGGSGLSIAASQLSSAVSLTTQVSGILPVANGGTGDNAFVANQVIIGGTTTTGALAQVAAGSSGQVLTSNGSSAPTWAAPATSGTVTRVGLADLSTAPIYTISNSPVTSSGTLDITLNTQAPNSVFAGPVTGLNAQPSFRALAPTDIPDLSATYILDSRIGAASGVAGLDGSGKVPYSQLPSALMTYKGAFSPLTDNLSTLDASPISGDVFRASADGIVVSGPFAGTQFYAGDFAIYNGTVWQRSPMADGVVSVNGASGAVTVNAINQ